MLEGVEKTEKSFTLSTKNCLLYKPQCQEMLLENNSFLPNDCPSSRSLACESCSSLVYEIIIVCLDNSLFGAYSTMIITYV